jgi:hypothetical protein
VAIQLKVSRRFLLFTAAFVWTFAAFMLLSRGISLSYNIKSSFWLKIIISLSAGGLFYLLLFSKISRKHISRIINLKNDNSCLFSFFSIRSYILMIIMITSGILLRRSGIIKPEYLALGYITMGIPLMVSAFRFYYHGINYR